MRGAKEMGVKKSNWWRKPDFINNCTQKETSSRIVLEQFYKSVVTKKGTELITWARFPSPYSVLFDRYGENDGAKKKRWKYYSK